MNDDHRLTLALDCCSTFESSQKLLSEDVCSELDCCDVGFSRAGRSSDDADSGMQLAVKAAPLGPEKRGPAASSKGVLRLAWFRDKGRSVGVKRSRGDNGELVARSGLDRDFDNASLGFCGGRMRTFGSEVDGSSVNW